MQCVARSMPVLRTNGQHIQLTTDAPVQELLEQVEAFVDATMEDAGS